MTISQLKVAAKTDHMPCFFDNSQFNSYLLRESTYVDKILETNKYKILVIEDDPISQRVVVLMLERLGYQVTATNKGMEALGIFKNFDLIISDVGLPDIDGIAICKTIRNQDTKNDIPIIALTANNFNDEIANAGFTEFMNKPIEVNLLEQNVEKCLLAKKN